MTAAMPLWIIGAGGHAKVVIETARAGGIFTPIGVLDDNPARRNTTVLGVPVRGTISISSIDTLAIERAVVAVGNNRARAELAARLDGRVTWATLVHPAATVATTARIGAGSVVFAGAVIQPDAALGHHVIINTGASVDHDSAIGDFVHVAPGVRLAGNVTVETGAFLGIGSVVVPGRTIGLWATVGAGGVVIRDIPAEVTATGVPARWTQPTGLELVS